MEAGALAALAEALAEVEAGALTEALAADAEDEALSADALEATSELADAALLEAATELADAALPELDDVDVQPAATTNTSAHAKTVTINVREDFIPNFPSL